MVDFVPTARLTHVPPLHRLLVVQLSASVCVRTYVNTVALKVCIVVLCWLAWLQLNGCRWLVMYVHCSSAIANFRRAVWFVECLLVFGARGKV